MKTEIEKRASKFIDETDMMQFSTMEIMVMFAEKELKAINYTPCCKSDSEQLLAVAKYVYWNYDESSSKKPEDYLKDFSSQ